MVLKLIAPGKVPSVHACAAVANFSIREVLVTSFTPLFISHSPFLCQLDAYVSCEFSLVKPNDDI
jgi:hypothetical protein